MPHDDAPEGFTHIEDAVEKWGSYRAKWFEWTREGPENGGLTGYKIPGKRGQFLKDAEVIEFLKPKPMGGSDRSAERA